MSDPTERALWAELERADRELVELLERRARTALALGAQRREQPPSPTPVTAASVEQALSASSGVLPREVLGKLVRAAATACVPLLQPAPIAVLGAPGSPCHRAAQRRFGEAAQWLPQAHIDDALAQVRAGHAQFAVVPLEDRALGLDTETLAALVRHELQLVACFDASSDEERPPRSSSPSSRSGAPRPSTWPPPAGRLPAAGEAVRYAVISQRPSRRTGDDRSALWLRLRDDAPGSLYALLAAFKDQGVSLSHIHSHPLPAHEQPPSPWSYAFFLELVGHASERAVISAIEHARPLCRTLRVLGSYADE